MASLKSDSAGGIIEQLDQLHKKEQAEVRNAERSWSTQAYDQTLAFFSDTKNTKQYISTALGIMKTGDNASLAAGAERGKATTPSFGDKYKAVLEQVKTKWFADQKSAGSLPWAMQDEKDRKAAALSAKAKTDLLENHLKDLRSTYHNFA